MQRRKKVVTALFASSLFTAWVTGIPTFATQMPSLNVMRTAEAAQTSEGVDWEKGEIIGTGYGVAPTGVTGARARLLARRAAMVEAQRSLADNVGGVQVDAETTVQAYEVANDETRTRVSALIKGATIVSEDFQTDGTYKVVMTLPLYGQKSLASAIMPDVRKDTPAQQLPQVTEPAIHQEASQGEAYTGLIVDASGLGLVPTFSPVVFDTNGRDVYGLKNIDYEGAIAHGMVGYAKSLAEAKNNPRVGAHPLIVRAESVRGGRNSVNPVNTVISVKDANFVLAASARSGFLPKGAVVFVR